MVNMRLVVFLATVLTLLIQTNGFVTKSRQGRSNNGVAVNGIFDKVGEFFEELDAFVDDATSRRLGAGSAFYGKRKSKFYGEDDQGRKKDKSVADPTEDYQGPTSTGLFTWVPDENGQMRPVTRGRRQTNLERNPKFWDRVYAEKEKGN